MEQFHPKVSVIIPFFNRIPYTVESIESVINQTYQDWELLLINDGSTDDIEPIRRIIEGNSKIRLLSQSNKGVSSARNLGISYATGKYIAFLDSDDLWADNKLEIQIAYMEQNDCYFSHTSYQRMDINGMLLDVVNSAKQCGNVYPELMSNCGIATPTVVVRKKILAEKKEPFLTDFHIGEDICLWIDISSKFSLAGIDIPLTYVRIGETTAALDPEKQAEGLQNILNYANSDAKYRMEFVQCRQLWNAICEQNWKKRKPLVSIIIPVYNGADYMCDAIDSALAQTYENIEVIVINDGSRDDGETDRIARSYGDKIRYFHKENGGVATALNLGIKKMNGEYFSWLSHDDMYKPDKIERELEQVIESGREDTIIAGGYDVVNKDGEFMYTVSLSNLYSLNQLNTPLFALLRGGINGCALLLHRSHFERVGLFDENLPSTQDYDLWFRMFRCWPVRYYSGSYVCSRWHENQGSKKMENHIADCNKLWIWMMENVSKEERRQISGSDYMFFKEMHDFLANGTNYDLAISYAKDCAEKLTLERTCKYDSDGIMQSFLVTGTSMYANVATENMWKDECQAIQQSISWKITKPLRMAKKSNDNHKE